MRGFKTREFVPISRRKASDAEGTPDCSFRGKTEGYGQHHQWLARRLPERCVGTGNWVTESQTDAANHDHIRKNEHGRERVEIADVIRISADA